MYSFLQQYFPICSVQVFSTLVKLKSMYFILWDATANGTASSFLGSVCSDHFPSCEQWWFHFPWVLLTLLISAWSPQTRSPTFLNPADMQSPSQLVWSGCHWVCHICWSLLKRSLSLLQITRIQMFSILKITVKDLPNKLRVWGSRESVEGEGVEKVGRGENM